jgi:hypothetical protein
MAAMQDVSALRVAHHRHWLCYVTPTLTLYLRDAPTQAVARRIIEVYRAHCPTDRLRFVTGGDAPAFTPLTEAFGQTLAARVMARMDRRRDIGLMVWDGQLRESWSLTIQGAPLRDGAECASFCRVVMPNDVAPTVMARMACELADSTAFLSGHAGFGAVFNADLKATAFDQIYAWAKRYPGLEVEDLNVTLPHMLDGIKGANWLTLLGSALAERVTSESWQVVGRHADVARLSQGVVVRAGDHPALGDRNRNAWPTEVAAVEAAFAGIKLRQHGEFAGRFGEDGTTLAWLQRYLDREAW